MVAAKPPTPISAAVSESDADIDADATVYTLSATPQNTSVTTPVSSAATAAIAAPSQVKESSIDVTPPSIELSSAPPPPPPSPPIKEFVFGEKKKSEKIRIKSLKPKDDKELESIKEFNKKKQESRKPSTVAAADDSPSPPPSPWGRRHAGRSGRPT